MAGESVKVKRLQIDGAGPKSCFAAIKLRVHKRKLGVMPDRYAAHP